MGDHQYIFHLMILLDRFYYIFILFKFVLFGEILVTASTFNVFESYYIEHMSI